MNIINSIKELPKNESIHIYGAGSFGMMLHDSIVFYRPDVKIVNFIDGYKHDLRSHFHITILGIIFT